MLRWALLMLIPAIAGYSVHGLFAPSNAAPVEQRQAHPAPPASIRVYGAELDLARLENPLRLEIIERYRRDAGAGWERYAEVVAAGRDVYYRNCFHCHGSLLDGQGHYAHGFKPRPTDFQDPTIIPQLQESYLFWRIVSGGPGLPREGAPWNSAMPVWHEMLSQADVWSVITFLFDYNGQLPRIWDAQVSATVTTMQEEIQARRAGIQGRELYRLHCAACHGEQGMGDGVAAELMYPRPRDFSLGQFKYKTSPGTLPPRDEDLVMTIKQGLPGTAMPGWSRLLSDVQIRSLIPVLKGFDVAATWAPDDVDEEAFDADGYYTGSDFRRIAQQEPLDGQITYTAASVALGQQAYSESCQECHGAGGRGNILSGKKLEDDWGNRIWPRDLTKPWTWRAAQSPAAAARQRSETIRNLYRLISIGIPGTPMPAHRAVEEGNKDPVSLEDRWHIANYVYSLREQTVQPVDGAVLSALRIAGSLPTSVHDERWNDAPAVTWHLLPNVIKDERLFTPLNDAVTVRALYDNERIAFLLELADRTESRPGLDYFSALQDESIPMHTDAMAIQFPMQDAYTASPMAAKPHFRHGDKRRHTTIWYWQAGSVEPRRDPAALLFEGAGADSPLKRREDVEDFSASGEWEDGSWRVLMSRPRAGGSAGDADFQEGHFIPIAFANWDGSNGELGARHTLSPWHWLYLPVQVAYWQVFGLPAGTALLVFLAGLLLVRSQRGKI